MVYIYESHMGGLYTSDEELEYESLYCETCGDSDQLLCAAKNMTEVEDVLKSIVNIGGGGYDYCHIRQIYNECENYFEENTEVYDDE